MNERDEKMDPVDESAPAPGGEPMDDAGTPASPDIGTLPETEAVAVVADSAGEVREEPVLPVETVRTVGEILCAARETAGFSTVDVARALKLGARQIEALERNDWSVLPGNTFVRGFVRNYARLVSVDPAPLMLLLDQSMQKPVVRIDVPPTAEPVPVSGKPKDRPFILVAVGLLLLALAAYFLLPDNILKPAAEAPEVKPLAGSEVPVGGVTPPSNLVLGAAAPAGTPVAAAEPAAAVPAAAATAAPVAAPVVAEADKGRLRFVVTAESWVEVRDASGQVLMSQRLSAGSEQSLAASGPLSVTIGYAPGVRLVSRGAPVDLAPHTRGDVARLTLE